LLDVYLLIGPAVGLSGASSFLLDLLMAPLLNIEPLSQRPRQYHHMLLISEEAVTWSVSVRAAFSKLESLAGASCLRAAVLSSFFELAGGGLLLLLVDDLGVGFAHFNCMMELSFWRQVRIL